MLSVIGQPVPRLLAPQEDKVITPMARITTNNKIFFMLLWGLIRVFSFFALQIYRSFTFWL
jgi:hypothetical protein